MKQVYISYNPYKLETKFLVDNEELKRNSRIREKCCKDARLQDWIEELPDLLCKEYADNDFLITFHGILQDYDDIVEVFGNAYKQGKIKCNLAHIPPKHGTENKDELIRNLYEKICNGPFEELKSQEIEDAFREQQSRDFTICVIATMSAGKSTLINAMLQTKLMPSSGDAKTAIITRVKDVSDDKSEPWRAEIYGTDDAKSPYRKYERITLDDMEELNNNTVVSRVDIEGNIPFVSAKDMSLILVDTPGAGMAHDDSHKQVQEGYLNKSAKELILFVLPPTFEAKDVADLLKLISEIMKVGGKQSKDRFLFVINKMDTRNMEDGPVENTLDKVKEVLKKYGIENPNLYPVTALNALQIRSVLKGASDNENVREAGSAVEKLFPDKRYYFDEYASLPSSLQEMIKEKIENAPSITVSPSEIDKMAQAACSNPMFADMYKNKYALILKYGNAALLHTGVPSLEAAIRQYVEKYAQTAKIHTFADAIKRNLEQKKMFEDLKKAISTNKHKAKEISAQIDEIQRQLNQLRDAKAYKNEIDAAIEQVKKQSDNKAMTVLSDYQKSLSQVVANCRGDILIDEIDDLLLSLKEAADTLEPAFRAELTQVIQEALEATSEKLIGQYLKKMKGIDTGSKMFSGFSMRMLETLAYDIPSPEALVERFQKTEDVSDGREFIKNTEKKWYKPWTWFQEKGYWREKYKRVTYVKADELCQEIISPIQNSLKQNCQHVQAQVISQTSELALMFRDEMYRVERIMNLQLQELKKCTKERSDADVQLIKTQKKLQWLQQMLGELDNILTI